VHGVPRESGFPESHGEEDSEAGAVALRVGHDDYSLQVENLPKAPPKAGQQGLFGEDEA
jgi:hypothetical protein